MMAEENYVFVWLLLILLGYAWIRFLLRRMLKRPVFEKFEAIINKFLPWDADKWVYHFFTTLDWKR